MTWDELAELLTCSSGEPENKVYVVRRDGLDTIALHFVPVAWLVSIKFVGALNIGVYQGEENCLVGTAQIPWAELTPKFFYVRRLREQQPSNSRFRSIPKLLVTFWSGFPGRSCGTWKVPVKHGFQFTVPKRFDQVRVTPHGFAPFCLDEIVARAHGNNHSGALSPCSEFLQQLSAVPPG